MAADDRTPPVQPTLDDLEQRAAAWDTLLLSLGGPTQRAIADNTDTAGRTASPAAMSEEQPRIPVTVLSGFLGAGKTTLLCRLLEQSPIRIVAIVNDIGRINVDAALVAAQTTTEGAETIEMQNGCACCVLGSDLRLTLEEIGRRPGAAGALDDSGARPDAIVVEASGVADPSGLAQSIAQVPSMQLDGIVTVVDAQAFAAQAQSPATRPTFARQLAAAHVVALTKTGNAADVAEIQQAVGALAPGRPVVAMDEVLTRPAAICEVLVGAAQMGARPTPAILDHDPSGFATATVPYPNPAPEAVLFALLDDIPDSVLRIKGWRQIADAQSSRWYELQVVGRRWRVRPVPTPPPGLCNTDDNASGELVVIGDATSPDFDAFVHALGDCSS